MKRSRLRLRVCCAEGGGSGLCECRYLYLKRDREWPRSQSGVSLALLAIRSTTHSSIDNYCIPTRVPNGSPRVTRCQAAQARRVQGSAGWASMPRPALFHAEVRANSDQASVSRGAWRFEAQGVREGWERVGQDVAGSSCVGALPSCISRRRGTYGLQNPLRVFMASW